MIIVNPCFALDFDSVDNSSSRKNYNGTAVQSAKTAEPTKIDQQINALQTLQTAQPSQTTSVKQSIVQEQVVAPEPQTIQNYEKLPNVPKLPDKAFSKTVAPVNTMYTGKIPDKNSLTPCSDIKVGDLILDEHYKKTKFVTNIIPKTSTVPKTTTPKTIVAANYKYRTLPKGIQFRVVNTTKITDYMGEGQLVTFKSTQAFKTPYLNIPANTKFIGRIDDAHRPQITCNGGLVSFKIVAAEINGYQQQLDGSIIKMNTERIRLSNLKGEHTYWKTTCKKAKWGQNKFKEYSKTSSKLASKKAGVIIAPFPYISGCALACASTVSSPVTALLGKGGRLIIPANTIFTIKLNEDAKIKY